MASKSSICKKCGYIMEELGLSECPNCNGTKFTTFWQGYTIIIDPTNSEVAKILGIENKGKFALRIN